MDIYQEAELTCDNVYSWLSSHSDVHGIVTVTGENMAQTLHQPLDTVAWTLSRLETLGKICFVQWRPSAVVVVREVADPVCKDAWSFVKTGRSPWSHTCEESISNGHPCGGCKWGEHHSDLIEWRRALIETKLQTQ
jgi:hypothetical protein